MPCPALPARFVSSDETSIAFGANALAGRGATFLKVTLKGKWVIQFRYNIFLGVAYLGKRKLLTRLGVYV
jgi:hypothetical protein